MNRKGKCFKFIVKSRILTKTRVTRMFQPHSDQKHLYIRKQIPLVTIKMLQTLSQQQNFGSYSIGDHKVRLYQHSSCTKHTIYEMPGVSDNFLLYSQTPFSPHSFKVMNLIILVDFRSVLPLWHILYSNYRQCFFLLGEIRSFSIFHGSSTSFFFFFVFRVPATD